jgi:hypothetical protein
MIFGGKIMIFRRVFQSVRFTHSVIPRRAYTGGRRPDPFQQIASNPQALKVFQAIQNDAKLMEIVSKLGTLLQTKGYMNIREPKQPTPWEMAKIMLDSDIRKEILALNERLKALGIDLTSFANVKNEQQVDVMKLLLGGGTAQSLPPPAPPSIGKEGDEKSSNNISLSNFFKRK